MREAIPAWPFSSLPELEVTVGTRFLSQGNDACLDGQHATTPAVNPLGARCGTEPLVGESQRS